MLRKLYFLAHKQVITDAIQDIFFVGFRKLFIDEKKPAFPRTRHKTLRVKLLG
jgi:hypothetical protein